MKTLIARAVRTLRTQRSASDKLSEEAYQCLFAIRLLLDLLRKEKGMEDADALRVAEKAVAQLSEAMTRYANQWGDVDYFLHEIEGLDLKKTA